jgi:hypothetical protein
MISYFYEKGMSAYGVLLAQFHHYSNTTIAIATISVASLFALAPTAYRDYKTFSKEDQLFISHLRSRLRLLSCTPLLLIFPRTEETTFALEIFLNRQLLIP